MATIPSFNVIAVLQHYPLPLISTLYISVVMPCDTLASTSVQLKIYPYGKDLNQKCLTLSYYYRSSHVSDTRSLCGSNSTLFHPDSKV